MRPKDTNQGERKTAAPHLTQNTLIKLVLVRTGVVLVVHEVALLAVPPLKHAPLGCKHKHRGGAVGRK